MKTQLIHCGTLKARAKEMIKPLSEEEVRLQYTLDQEGYIKLSLNSLLVIEGECIVLIDPGCADFLPSRLMREYGLEIPVSLEDELYEAGVLPEMVSDVVFTHLHFDHGSGAFKRVPGHIQKRFPNARYHVLKEHYDYASSPHPKEADSFFTGFFKYLDQLHWLEDWTYEWMDFRIFNGHTKGMPEVYSGYDLDPELAKREKQEFLYGMGESSRLLLFHDPLIDSMIYP